jgi:serine/threonine protein phosphatase PrpC
MDSVVEEALMEAFVATDGDFLASGGQAGSTASTVLVLGNRAYCGNVGDSRTVLCRTAEEGGGGGGRGGSSLSVHAVALSEDHKPTREDEAARIKAAGGFIINKRVMGELAVSRAFGDAEFKKGISEILGEAGDSSTGLKRATSTAGRDSNDGDDDYDGGESKQDLSKPLVVAEPEVKCVTLYPSEIPVCAPGGGGGGGGQQQLQQRFRDEFLLLACE